MAEWTARIIHHLSGCTRSSSTIASRGLSLNPPTRACVRVIGPCFKRVGRGPPRPGIVHHLSGPITRAHAPPPRRCGGDKLAVRPTLRGRDPTSDGARRPSLSPWGFIPSDSRVR